MRIRPLLAALLLFVALSASVSAAAGCLSDRDCPAGQCCSYTQCAAANCASRTGEPPALRAGHGLPLRTPDWAVPVAMGLYAACRLLTAYVGRTRTPPPGSWRHVLGRLAGATWHDAPGSLKLPLTRMPPSAPRTWGGP